MEFRDLKKQYIKLKSEIDAAVQEVCANANFISGRQVNELEQRLASFVGVKHCVCCANGTDALSLVLMAWDIKKGDAVFVPDFTFFASGETVAFEGATPIFVDVDENTFNMDALSLERAIEEVIKKGELTPKAVIAVDLFGLPANYPKIENVASKFDLKLLEDGAQGFGGAINERRACSFGDAATTSFFPAKPLGCYGDGGAVFTNDDETASLIRSLAVHGKGSFKYDNVRIGINSRLDTLQAAILKVKLDALIKYELDDINKAAKAYTSALGGSVEVPKIAEGFYSSWAQYTIRLKSGEQRDALQASLKDKGIPTMVYYPKPMHKQTAFGNTPSALADCPVTERLCETVLSLPMHPYITKEEIHFVADAVNSFFK